MNRSKHVAVLKFEGLEGALRALNAVLPEIGDSVRSVYILRGSEGCKAVLELDIEPRRLDESVEKLSSQGGFVEARVERFPALLIKDRTYDLGDG